MTEESLDLLIDVDDPTVVVDQDFTVFTNSSEISIEVDFSPSNVEPDYDVSTPSTGIPLLTVAMAEGPPGLPGTPGLPGPPGPPGPPGLPGLIVPADGITYSQAIPESVWEIANPFAYRPEVDVYDNDGNEMFADVSFPPGLIRVEFYYPMTGTLRLH